MWELPLAGGCSPPGRCTACRCRELPSTTSSRAPGSRAPVMPCTGFRAPTMPPSWPPWKSRPEVRQYPPSALLADELVVCRLRDGPDDDLVQVHMVRGTDRIAHHIGHVLGGERLFHSLVDLLGGLRIAEASQGEFLGLHQPGRNLDHADVVFDFLEPERICYGVLGELRGVVTGATL